MPIINPEISVLIPVYNTENYIEKCLTSLFSNTFADKCEFIIVNDCSTDNSIEIINKTIKYFQNLEKSIILHNHTKNRGLAAVRNTSMSLAHGKYILFVDSDDWVEKTYIESLYNKITESNADCVICGFFSEFERSKKTKIIIPPRTKNEWKYIYTDLLSGRMPAYMWNKIFKKSIVDENKIMWQEGLNLWEDFYFVAQFFFYANTILTVNKPLYHYRKQISKTITSTMNIEKFNQFTAVLNYITEFLKIKNIYNQFETNYINLCIKSKIITSRKFSNYNRPYSKLFTETEISYIKQSRINSFIILIAKLIIKQKYQIVNLIYLIVNSIWKY